MPLSQPRPRSPGRCWTGLRCGAEPDLTAGTVEEGLAHCTLACLINPLQRQSEGTFVRYVRYVCADKWSGADAIGVVSQFCTCVEPSWTAMTVLYLLVDLPPESWPLELAHQVVNSERRRRNRGRKVLAPLSFDRLLEQSFDARHPSAEAELDGHARQLEFLRDLMKSLPSDDRDLLRRWHVDGHSALQLAAELGRHRNTLGSRFSRIKATLHKQLEQWRVANL